MVTSFSSKSEVALNLSTDGTVRHLHGLPGAASTQLDVSNSNTPGVIDPSNPVPGAYPRVVAQLDSKGKFRFTETNAYSGNNGRAAILNDAAGQRPLHRGQRRQRREPSARRGHPRRGRADPRPAGRRPSSLRTRATRLRSAASTLPQLGRRSRQGRQGHNFRGLTVFNNVAVLHEGQRQQRRQHRLLRRHHRNGCPSGVGLPAPDAPLPTTPITYDPDACFRREGANALQHVHPQGLPDHVGQRSRRDRCRRFPFGIWFANADTLYVADEGNGDNTYSTANGRTPMPPRRQRPAWRSGSSTPHGTWNLAYTLQSGLNLGTPYTPSGRTYLSNG